MSMLVEITKRVDIATAEGRSELQAAMAAGLAWRAVSSRPARSGVTPATRPTRRRGRRKIRGVNKIDALLGGKMHRMRKEGVSLREIARACGISVSGAGNYLRRTDAEAVGA